MSQRIGNLKGQDQNVGTLPCVTIWHIDFSTSHSQLEISLFPTHVWLNFDSHSTKPVIQCMFFRMRNYIVKRDRQIDNKVSANIHSVEQQRQHQITKQPVKTNSDNIYWKETYWDLESRWKTKHKKIVMLLHQMNIKTCNLNYRLPYTNWLQ